MADTLVRAKFRYPDLCETDPARFHDSLREHIGDYLGIGESHKFDADTLEVISIVPVETPQGACPRCQQAEGFDVTARHTLSNDGTFTPRNNPIYDCRNCGRRLTEDAIAALGLPVYRPQGA